MIYFVRHGATDWNDFTNEFGIKTPRCQGRADQPLNAHGISQAQETAKLLQNVQFDRVICSPLIRASQTLDIIYHGHTKKEFDERLIERDFGAFEGLTRAQFDFKKFWTYPPTPNENSNGYVFPSNAESIPQIKIRIESLLNEIKHFDSSNVLLVSHGGVGCVLFSYFKALPEKNFYLSIEMPHGKPLILNPKDIIKY